MDLDTSNSDECYVTAKQIFHYCGAVNSGTLRVDSLMEKFAPFVKTNKAEYSFLRSLLDPDKTNPDINVTELAQALTKYSESQKRGDLDESFNFKCGQVPQDSDSGISNDGFQLLEDLQCELREKSHLASKLRSQLDFTDRQHEEALAAITAERDTLRAQLNMLRDENASLAAARRDCEDACEKLCGSERALDETRRELDGLRRRAKAQAELAQTLEGDKLTLQELLNKSKEECHRINEMYASRQSNLLEQNEALRSQSAELSARASDQDEFLQQLLREKVVLEMELKDMLNKSSHAASRLDRSVDVSYTEDQMLTALDSLTADSRFVPDVASISTQVDVPCVECVKRSAPAPQNKSWRRFIWEHLKSLFSVLAGVCCVAALIVLYNVSNYHYASRRCIREAPAVPWRWLNVHDLLDFVFRIEYVGEVPM